MMVVGGECVGGLDDYFSGENTRSENRKGIESCLMS